ncbi:MAG: FkbM family methyltransferase [Parvibaculum sp.]|uniref:FkbM family methyltransferase n=1 Tax=Parvibaculum sp. TaxID=2024848 RepID=UPI002ABA0F53|nr:FkbM family methyltransferase [Parvibaculum sp.]MDZ4381133.1 FkbM family methyltransferase [Parvibaculum sp.]
MASLPPALSLRQRLTWAAHLFKAIFYQYHREFAERIAPLVPADGIIVDVGAHSGQFAKLFSRLVPRGRVYAFEPGAYALSILRPVAGLRGLRNVEIMPAGLSDKPGAETLNVPLKRHGTLGFGLAHIGAELSGRDVVSQEIALTTLDLFADEARFPRLDFLKADIEGWEPHFLRGARATIARFRPSVMIEVSPRQLAQSGSGPEDVFSIFAPLGYRIFKTYEHEGYRLHPVDGFDTAADYLFVPGEKAALVSVD